MWWFTVPGQIAVEAPRNHLSLYKRLLEYKDINAGISASAVEAFGVPHGGDDLAVSFQ